MYSILVKLTKGSVIKFRRCLAPFLDKHSVPRDNLILLCSGKHIEAISASLDKSYKKCFTTERPTTGYIVEMSPLIKDILKFNMPIETFRHVIQDSYYFLNDINGSCIGFGETDDYSILNCDSQVGDNRCLFKILDNDGIYYSWGYYKLKC